MGKPNCDECKWQGDVPGSVHSCCDHPEVQADHVVGDALAGLMSMLAPVGRTPPMRAAGPAQKLNIKGDAYGTRSGWFNWPWNFDPAWLENCDGFEAAEEKSDG